MHSLQRISHQRRKLFLLPEPCQLPPDLVSLPAAHFEALGRGIEQQACEHLHVQRHRAGRQASDIAARVGKDLGEDEGSGAGGRRGHLSECICK